MRTAKILKELEKYLTEFQVGQLRLSNAIGPSVQLCLAVSEIVYRYNGKQEDEDRICYLLTNLCKNHFNKKP